MKNYTGVA